MGPSWTAVRLVGAEATGERTKCTRHSTCTVKFLVFPQHLLKCPSDCVSVGPEFRESGFYPVGGGGGQGEASPPNTPTSPPNIQASPTVSVACMHAVT